MVAMETNLKPDVTAYEFDDNLSTLEYQRELKFVPTKVHRIQLHNIKSNHTYILNILHSYFTVVMTTKVKRRLV